MVLQLYGGPYTACTKRVAVVLREMQIPFELHTIRLVDRDHKKPEFMANQPFGQVPYIVDDGFILYESRAITRYLALQYAGQGTSLMPPASDIKKVALFEQAASVEYSAFDPYASKYIKEKFFAPMRGETVNQAVCDEALAALNATMDVYDQILGKQAYLAGDEITLVDLAHLPWGVMFRRADSNLMEAETRPNVARWWKDVSSRPAWLSVAQAVLSGVEKYVNEADE